MLKIRRPNGRLIFNMGIATLGKTVFLIETAPRLECHLENIFLEYIFVINANHNSTRNTFRCVLEDPADYKSKLDEVMAWCRQAASH